MNSKLILSLIRLRSNRTSALLLVLSLFHLPLTAQTPAPGGVAGPKLWYTTEISSDGQLIWKDQLTGQSSHRQPVNSYPKDQYYLNFNPAYPFVETMPGIQLSLPPLQQEKWTLFTVYQSRDTLTEKSIWSFARAGHTHEILTTHRLADLQRFEYLNFPHATQTAPQISTYLHHQSPNESAPLDRMTLQLGHPPQDHQLPIRPFAGKLPEFLLYERVLSPEERQRVESYLAIKYGTNLAPDQRLGYLDAGGQMLYDPTQSGDYSHRITGIGRDDRSGLYQKQSTSSYEPGLLTISTQRQASANSTNSSALPDRHFLLWADNNEALHWEEKQPLQPPRLQRSWLVKPTGIWAPIATELQFDTKRMPLPAGPGETYWLLIDRSGQGKFDGTETIDYYPLTQLTTNGKSSFQPVHWDTDGSGSDVFTIAVGPELLVQARMELPTCFPEQTGSLQIQAMGGRAPYQFQLRNDQSFLKHWIQTEPSVTTWNDLPPGKYELRLTDANQREYRETFFFQSADAPAVALATRYQLPATGALRLDAGLSANDYRQYQWQSPDGQITANPVLEITQTGTYQIQIDQDGCLARQNIIVEPAPRGNFQRVELFPNPSSNGRFQVRVHLKNTAALHLRVFDPGGRLILQQRQAGSDYYHTGDHLTGKGTYLVQFRSQTDQITLPLIVQ